MSSKYRCFVVREGDVAGAGRYWSASTDGYSPQSWWRVSKGAAFRFRSRTKAANRAAKSGGRVVGLLRSAAAEAKPESEGA